MPSCTFACRRAVQRQLLPPSDTVWITDDALYHAFQRLVRLSNTTKRHGSFVPGPLEARRRLGKRRMAHASKPTPTSPIAFGPFWNIFGEVDRTSFQWEAPTARPSTLEAPTDSLPGWLSRWTAPPPPAPETLVVERKAKTGRARTRSSISPMDVSRFRSSIREADPDQMVHLCQEFNERLKRSLTLGEVCNTTLNLIVTQAVTKDIRRAFPNTLLFEQHCLALYGAVWEGISACKVIRPVDFDGLILNRLLNLLSELPITTQVQAIAGGVIRSASVAQLRKMRDGINRLVYAWARTWIVNHDSTNGNSCSVEPDALIADIDRQVLHLNSLVESLHNRPHKNINFAKVQADIHETRLKIIRAIDAVDQVEDVVFSAKNSVRILAEVFANIPKDAGILWSIVKPSSDRIANLLKNAPETAALQLRDYWLLFIAELTHEHETYFVRAWQISAPSESPLDEATASDIVLKFWISRGLIEKPHIIRNAWRAMPSSHHKFSSLLTMVDSHREQSWHRADDLFALLHKLDKYSMVPGILSRMQKNGLRLPTVTMAKVLRIVSDRNPRAGYKIYRLWLLMRADTNNLRLERYPDFILSLIRDTTIPPKMIWDMLRIPLYQNAKTRAPPGFPNNRKGRLSPSMIALVKKMALTFARSECRPPRVALRNVIQCLHHLRIHGEPVTPELTKAVSHAGLTRELLKNGTVSQERLAWAIALIDWAEGKEVADAVDKTVYRWRRYHNEKQWHDHQRQRALQGISPSSIID